MYGLPPEFPAATENGTQKYAVSEVVPSMLMLNEVGDEPVFEYTQVLPQLP